MDSYLSHGIQLNKKNSRGFVFCAFILIGISLSACGGQENPTSSDLDGKFSWASESVTPPAPKSQDGLKQIVSKLGLKLKGIFGNASSPTQGSAASGKLDQIYLKEVIEAGGIPRSQGESIVRSLVAKDSEACGAANCARVFGVSEKEVPIFFDALLDRAGTSQALALPQNKAARDTVIRSLIPEKALINPLSDQERVSRIYLENPQNMPLPKYTPSVFLEPQEIRSKAGSKFIKMISDYTGKNDYAYFRRVETTPKEQYHTIDLSSSYIRGLKSRSQVINDGLKKLPIFHSVVYRGLKAIPKEQLARWYTVWKSKSVIGLGPQDKPATTSTTWKIEVAKKFMIFAAISPEQKEYYTVLLEISNHRGISIEAVSKFPREHEVLLPNDQKVIIESIAPIEGTYRQILIKMQGVDSAAAGSHELESVRRVA